MGGTLDLTSPGKPINSADAPAGQPPRVRSAVRNAASKFVWSIGAIVALVLGETMDDFGLSPLSILPLLLLAIAYVLHDPAARLTSALIASLGLLLISRSVLSTEVLNTTTPLVVAGLIALAIVLDRNLIVPKLPTALVGALVVLLIVPTVIQADLTTTGKAVGIGAMWILLFAASANVTREQGVKILRFIVAVGCAQAVLAIMESLLKLEVVREFIVGSAADEDYTVRKNVILGDWTNRAQGTLGYPIPFAAFLVVVVMIVLFSVAVRNLRLKVGILVLLGVALALSGTRSAVVAAAAGLGVYCISLAWTAWRTKTKVPGFKWAIGATLLLVVAGIGFFVRSLLIGDFSLLHRSAVIEGAFELGTLPLAQVLFGSGYNAAPVLQDMGFFQTENSNAIDNALISQVIVSGVVGLVALIALIVYAIRRSSHSGRAVIAAIVTFFFFFDVLSWHAITALLFCAIGFAFVIDAPERNESGKHARSPQLLSKRYV